MAKSRTTRRKFDVDEQVALFEQKRSVYIAFTRKLKALVEEILENADIKYHVVESRTKSIESFRDKITRVTKQYSQPLDQITDLTGIRIIVYYLEDVDAVCRLIEEEFRLDDESSVDKSLLLKPNEFGYRSVHYIVSLPSNRKDLLEWRPFATVRAEIQVRTVLQHAWASISHTLDYKHEEDVPSPLRRKLFRLAGLLELSDEEFSGLRESERNFAGNVHEELGRGQIDIELNSVSAAAYLQESPTIDQIVKAAESTRFTVTKHFDDTSDLISLCSFLGITTIRELDNELKQSLPWVASYLDAQTKSNRWHASPAVLIELVLLRTRAKQIPLTYLIEHGWAKSIAREALAVANESSIEA
jgi:putative GTP pyrophosphokinase